MAARENQGLQIALIIFVMLTIILIVTSYLFFSNFTKEREKNTALATEKSNSDSAANKARDESAAMKTLLGVGQGDTPEAVQEVAKKDLDAHGEGLADAKRNYRALVGHLVEKLRKYEATNNELTKTTKELEAKLKANDAAAEKQIATYTSSAASTAADLEKERKDFTAAREEINTQKDELAGKFNTQRKQAEEVTRKSGEEITTLTGRLTKSESIRKAMIEENDRGEKASELPDGKVLRINQRGRLVWINVGSADGLRPQTTFSVVAPEDINPFKSKPKAMIEVVRLTNAHQAEARIVEDDLSNPIMSGDLIFSAWEPGRPEHFALAGILDLDNNGDTEGDREQLRDLISINGGVIDTDVSPEGKKTGEMTINTKFLVLGTAPGGESSEIDAYSAILSEAQSLGVKTLSLHEFLDYLGYKPEDRTVVLSEKAKSTDFKPRLPNGVQPKIFGQQTAKDKRNPRPGTSKKE